MKTTNEDITDSEFKKMNEAIRQIQYTAEGFSCGNIRLDGSTQEKINEVSVPGNDDPFFHSVSK